MSLIVLLNDAACCPDCAQSSGSGKDTQEAVYDVRSSQSSPAIKMFYSNALLSAAGSKIVQDIPLVSN